jgi:hypothetical protein
LDAIWPGVLAARTQCGHQRHPYGGCGLCQHVLYLLSDNWLGEFSAKPIELPLRVRELAVNEPQLLHHYSDVTDRSLCCPFRA